MLVLRDADRKQIYVHTRNPEVLMFLTCNPISRSIPWFAELAQAIPSKENHVYDQRKENEDEICRICGTKLESVSDIATGS